MSGAANSITVVIDGVAVAAGRPRMTRQGFAFTPQKTRKFQAHARLVAQLVMDGRPPIVHPVHLKAVIELPIPTSWSKRRDAAALAGAIRPTSRPDLDNYLKGATDALSGIVVADDSLIVEIAATKQYGRDPKIVLVVTPLLDAEPSNRRVR
jgi:Holliday junction resolvase RusA-like endonuclease